MSSNGQGSEPGGAGSDAADVQWFPLDVTAARIGGYRWLESRLFAVVGGWVPAVPDASVKLMFARHSQHHAERSLRWLERLPYLNDLNPDSLSVAPSGAVEQWFDSLAASAPGSAASEPVDGPAGGFPPEEAAEPALEPRLGSGPGAGVEATVVRLVALYQVALPHLVAAYTAHRERCSPVADGPIIRTLGAAIADATTDLVEGQRALDEFVDSAPNSAELRGLADDLGRRFDNELDAAGGIVTPLG